MDLERAPQAVPWVSFCKCPHKEQIECKLLAHSLQSKCKSSSCSKKHIKELTVSHWSKLVYRMKGNFEIGQLFWRLVREIGKDAPHNSL